VSTTQRKRNTKEVKHDTNRSGRAYSNTFFWF
jgi:hypothetical protein